MGVLTENVDGVGSANLCTSMRGVVGWVCSDGKAVSREVKDLTNSM